MGSQLPLTRDQTHTPCIGRRRLNHWTTREVPQPLSDPGDVFCRRRPDLTSTCVPLSSCRWAACWRLPSYPSGCATSTELTASYLAQTGSSYQTGEWSACLICTSTTAGLHRTSLCSLPWVSSPDPGAVSLRCSESRGWAGLQPCGCLGKLCKKMWRLDLWNET